MHPVIAKIVSILFHPLLATSIGLLFLLNAGTYLDFLSFGQKRTIFLIVLNGTAVLPLSLIPFFALFSFENIHSTQNPKHRSLPLFISLIFFAFTWFLMLRMNAPGLILAYIKTASTIVLVCTVLSIKFNINLHMIAMGALAGILLSLALRYRINLHIFMSAAFLFGGLTGWARLILHPGYHKQVYTGYIFGFMMALFLMYSF